MALILLGSISTQTVAQQKQVPIGPPAPEVEEPLPDERSEMPPLPLQVVAATQRLIPYDRVIYVLDVSCSMSNKLADAIPVVDVFASDSFKASVITFNDSHHQWVGVPCDHEEKKKKHKEDCLPSGWVWMPKHRNELFRHLRAFSGGGGTDPTSALGYAVREAPEGTLIVLISDGDFGVRDGTRAGKKIFGPLSTVRAAQAWRRMEKLAPVQILVWATSEADSKRESLVEVAKLGGGGLWRADARQSGPW